MKKRHTSPTLKKIAVENAKMKRKFLAIARKHPKDAAHWRRMAKSFDALKLNPTKRKAKKAVTKRRVRKVNPAPLLYIITAQGTGKKMHYDGVKFSERERVRTFPTVEAARKCAVELIMKYPMLRKYRVKIETNEHRPGK